MTCRIIGSIITIYVGSSATKFYVHKNLLLQSPFFRAALEGDFTEAHTGEIRLPEDDPDIFAIYAHWLYTGDIACEVEAHSSMVVSEHFRRYKTLLKCYFLGDRTCHNQFTDAVMDAIIYHYQTRIEHARYRPWFCHVNLVYENLMQADVPLKRWLVDLWAKPDGDEDVFVRRATTDNSHAEFVLDLAKVLMKRKCDPLMAVAASISDCERYHIEAPKMQANGPSDSSTATTVAKTNSSPNCAQS